MGRRRPPVLPRARGGAGARSGPLGSSSNSSSSSSPRPPAGAGGGGRSGAGWARPHPLHPRLRLAEGAGSRRGAQRGRGPAAPGPPEPPSKGAAAGGGGAAAGTPGTGERDRRGLGPPQPREHPRALHRAPDPVPGRLGGCGAVRGAGGLGARWPGGGVKLPQGSGGPGQQGTRGPRAERMAATQPCGQPGTATGSPLLSQRASVLSLAIKPHGPWVGRGAARASRSPAVPGRKSSLVSFSLSKNRSGRLLWRAGGPGRRSACPACGGRLVATCSSGCVRG